MRELTNWEIWQIQKYGNVLPLPNLKISEPGEEESERFAEWSHDQYERQLWEYQDQYTNTRY